jgi:tetratricopeptide (TPR) repeat protein
MVEMERGNEMRGYVPLGYVFLASMLASHRQDSERALQIIDECLEGAPEYVLAISCKAEILGRQGRYEEARDWFKKAIATKGLEDRNTVVDEDIAVWKAHSNIATSYVQEERYEDAIPWLEEAHRNKPDVWMIVERLAWVFERCRRYFDAEIVLREAFERQKTEQTATAYVNYLVRRQRLTRALEVIEESIRTLDGPIASSLNVAAAVIVRKMGSADPVPYLQAALEIAPGNGLALGLLEEIYRERSDELALARLRRDELDAPMVNEGDFARRTHRLLQEKRFEEVVRAAEDGLVMTPGSSLLLYNLGLALAQMDGETERAIHALGLIRGGESNVVEAGAFLRANLLDHQGRAGDAIGVLEAAFGPQPANESALLLRARLLETVGEKGKAEESLRLAMGAGRNRVALELAALLLRDGRYAEARGIASEAMATA